MFKYSKIIRYVIAGATATIVNLIVLYAGVHYFSLWYLFSAVIAFCCGLGVSYVLQKFWTFGDYSTQGMHIQFSLFSTFALVMLLLNTLFVYIGVDMLGFWYIFVQAAASAIIAILNYSFFNKVVFF